MTIDGEQITLADFQVALDKDGDILTENFVEKDGAFSVNFYFLEPGVSYPVSLIEPAGVKVLLDEEFPDEVSVTSGATYRKSFEIIAVSSD